MLNYLLKFKLCLKYMYYELSIYLNYNEVWKKKKKVRWFCFFDSLLTAKLFLSIPQQHGVVNLPTYWKQWFFFFSLSFLQDKAKLAWGRGPGKERLPHICFQALGQLINTLWLLLEKYEFSNHLLWGWILGLCKLSELSWNQLCSVAFCFSSLL